MGIPTSKLNGECSTELDCQLNGICSDGKCVCDAAWSGSPNCSKLALLAAKFRNGYGYLNSSTSSWGGGVIYDAESATYVMQVDEMNMGCGLGTWGHNSHSILATSKTPSGPYTKQRVLVDSWAHGSTPGRDPKSGKWLFNHMGDGTAKSCNICSSGITPKDAPSGPCKDSAAVKLGGSFALSADSPAGPFTVEKHMVNGANCESFFTADGKLYMACPSGGMACKSPEVKAHCNNQNAFLHMQVAESFAEAQAGHYKSMPVSYVLGGTEQQFGNCSELCFNWEDQNIWIDKRGNFHTLFHAFRGQPNDYPICDRSTPSGRAYCSALGGHAYSKDGMHWYISPVAPYTPTVQYEDGSNVTFRARERPHLIFDPNSGEISHLLTGVGDPGCGGNTGCAGADHTFTLAQPVQMSQAHMTQEEQVQYT